MFIWAGGEAGASGRRRKELIKGSAEVNLGGLALHMAAYLPFVYDAKFSVFLCDDGRFLVGRENGTDDFWRAFYVIDLLVTRLEGRVFSRCGGLVSASVLVEFPANITLACVERELAFLGPLPGVELQRLRGFSPQESGYDAFCAATSPTVLKSWALAHYSAAGINDPSSLAVIHRARSPKYIEECSLTSVRLSAAGVRYMNHYKIKVYGELMLSGVKFPPLILGRTRILCEGYHRFMAAQSVGFLSLPAIQLC